MPAHQSKFFSPATALLGRLRLSRKFFLILLVFIIPLAYMSWGVVADKQRQVLFHETQLSGLQRLDDTSSILANLVRLRDLGYASALGFQSSFDEPDAKAEIEQRIKQLATADSNSSRQQLEEVMHLWQELNTGSGEALQSHSLGFQLSLAIHQYRQRLAENYQLLLGTDLASYQLSHVAVDSLAYTVDVTSALRGLGSGIIARGHYTPESFIKISYYAGELDSNLDELARAFAIIGHSHPHLLQRSEQVLSAVRTYLEQTQSRVIEPDAFEISAARHALSGRDVLQSLMRLQQETVATLKQRLEQQIQNQTWQMYEVVGISAAIILLVMYLFSGFYYSMKQGIQQINGTLANIARGNLEQRAEVHSRDEIHTIAENLNHTAGQLTELVKIAYSRQQEGAP
ncbi:MAG: HAMP domain-containing protein [Gammaproteobacteria bacterium]|nr:HAMP domain-containing protein [Gammaproteobacteria bacterium]